MDDRLRRSSGRGSRDPEADESIQMVKVQRSAQWLADHFEVVPLYLFAFVHADPTGGSIFPAVWSAQLAARGHGVGSSLTVVLGFSTPMRSSRSSVSPVTSTGSCPAA